MFRKAAMNLLVKTATDTEVQDLKEQFKALDIDGNGMITPDDFKQVIKKKQLQVSNADINEIFD